MKRIANVNRGQIWSAYPPQSCTENINKSQEDLSLNLSYGTLEIQKVHLFQYRPDLVSISSSCQERQYKKIAQRTFSKFEQWDLKCPNYHKFSLKPLFEKDRLFQYRPNLVSIPSSGQQRKYKNISEDLF